MLPQQIVPVEPEHLHQEVKNRDNPEQGLVISIKGYSIHVTESTSMPLLTDVLKAV